MALISGWWLGFGSSGHCMGMCGPIALALPFRSADGKMNWLKYGSYHSGRILTYVLLGGIIAIVGQSIHWREIGQIISLLAGIMLIVMAVSYINQNKVWQPGWLAKVTPRINRVWQHAFQSRSTFAVMGAGAANGLLPCGMVYAAGLAAVGIGSSSSIALMAGFGLGTLPVFILLPTLSGLISRYANIWRWFIPATLVLTGLWLILRAVLSYVSMQDGFRIILPGGEFPMCVSL